MTPQEIKEAAKALQDEIGPRSTVEVSVAWGNLGDRDRIVRGYCRPMGSMSDGPAIFVNAEDWDDAFDKIRAKWAEIKEDAERSLVRKMALAIIRITADVGECSNASLRNDGFAEQDIEQYGDDACREADEMASNGPFSIKTLAGANAA